MVLELFVKVLVLMCFYWFNKEGCRLVLFRDLTFFWFSLSFIHKKFIKQFLKF